MIYYAAQYGAIVNLLRNNLRTVRQHIKRRSHRLVLLEDFWNDDTLATQACKFEYGYTITCGGGGQNVFPAIFIKNGEDSNNFNVCTFQEQLQNIGRKLAVADNGNF